LNPPYQLYFGVKYFPYDPLLLQEDISLYMMYLQLRREVKDGRVICSESERGELLAYIFQAEGSDYDDKYIHKHQNFFANLTKNSRKLETAVLQAYQQLRGTNPQTCEMKLMEKALPVTFYNQEVHPVRSDAQPGLKRLTLTLGPVGIGLYQGTVKLDIFGWMEIWNVGYINHTFWFRIVRDGEKSKHKFHFEHNKTCEGVWKSFRKYFQFYIQDRKLDPKLLWGRVPPQVQRVTLFSEQSTPSIKNMNIRPKISIGNMTGLLSDPGSPGNSLLQDHYGVNGDNIRKQALSENFSVDNSLSGSNRSSLSVLNEGSTKLEGLFQQNNPQGSFNSTNTFTVTGDTESKIESLTVL